MSIAVVTDSTAYLPEGFAERYGVRSVGLHVSVDGAAAVGEADFGPGELARAFDRKHRVTTSGATPAELARAYRAALDGGAEGVVSIHLSRRLSGTWDAARLAARDVDPQRVRVVDSRSTAMGLGFSVLAAAATAETGADLSAVESKAALTAERTTTLFSVQTLEYLRRGGRIGTATAVLGTALAIKPLLHVHEGRIDALEKVRTTSRAMTRLLEVSLRAAGSGPVAIAVHHLAAPERAEQLGARLRDRLPHAECVVSEVGAVIGAHIGPGAVGVVVLPGGWKPSN
ncbi:DegV family protein [Saccharopolyspora taberi]|uniref:DegV family protein n=1 Tax=Saccharopolyspora taberi TaxID=60895 RepID=A0ABN3V3P4_9PSEU